ncbi:hypothetical protein QBC46DRAFT_367655 [Diplogelasinospora grovesii]|uniref:Glycosyl transferase n=1 Tax=Diplogelasinospora grovesii TaxID=303347 RepID=A0AAN6RZV5_9PEZI|nr:hypothetical protein QBC46DRAFT_367655 [Diplogelasinospora grovesii]
MVLGFNASMRRFLTAASLLVVLVVLVKQHSHHHAFVNIPIMVHYIYILREGVSEFSFEFKHFLSVYATWHYWRPDTIYLHTNAPDEAIELARDGRRGKWNQLLLNIPNLQVRSVQDPKVAGNGREITVVEHKTDFIRQEVIREMGGIYLDFDAHPLRGISPLRRSGFNAIFGQQHGGQINNGVFLGRARARLLDMWRDEMHKVYDGGWTTHGNDVLTRIAPRVMRIPGEVLVLEQDAFQPAAGRWKIMFVSLGCTTTPASLSKRTRTCTAIDYTEELRDRLDYPEGFPAWEMDYSSTYVLHASDPWRNGNSVEGFEHVTPRYILERKSNFARAVYPVAKHMYDAGLIRIDDSWESQLGEEAAALNGKEETESVTGT